MIIAVWVGALKNYRSNLGDDSGGRLVAAWLDRQVSDDAGPWVRCMDLVTLTPV